MQHSRFSNSIEIEINRCKRFAKYETCYSMHECDKTINWSKMDDYIYKGTDITFEEPVYHYIVVIFIYERIPINPDGTYTLKSNVSNYRIVQWSQYDNIKHINSIYKLAHSHIDSGLKPTDNYYGFII